MTPKQATALKRRIRSRIEVDKSTGCHNSKDALNRKNGYPRIMVDGRNILVHRLAYRLWKGDIQDTEVIHHACGNRTCVNPKHLQAVSSLENQAEMMERQQYLKRIAELEAALSACVCQPAHTTF